MGNIKKFWFFCYILLLYNMSLSQSQQGKVKSMKDKTKAFTIEEELICSGKIVVKPLGNIACFAKVNVKVLDI